MASHARLVVLGLLAVVYSVIGWRAVWIPTETASKARDSLHGDAYSDRNTLSAIRHYVDQGLGASCGLPVHNYSGPETPLSERKVYLHYPALPDLLGAAVAYGVQSSDEVPLRVGMALCSLLFAGLLLGLARRLQADPVWAWAVAGLWFASNYFVFWADSLHKHQYEEAAKAAFLLLAWRYYGSGRSTGWLLACALLYVLAANLSFEPIVYLAVVSVGWAWIYDGHPLSRFSCAMGVAALAGFGLHLLQVWCWLGSWDAVWADVEGAFRLRTLGEAHGQQLSELDRGLGWRDYLALPFSWLNRIERAYLIPGWTLLLLVLGTGRQLWREQPQRARLLGVLFLASIAWSLTLTQHYVVHAFTARHFVLWAGVAVAWLGPYYVQRLRADWSGQHLGWKLVHVGLVGYTLAMAITQHLIDYFRYGWLQRD